MTPIRLTQGGRTIGVAELHDAGAEFLWPILEMCFHDARTITRTNAGWVVDLESRTAVCVRHQSWTCILDPLPICHFVDAPIYKGEK